jgi:squalene-hopene/tetraprenyl-beta-curcumene cyclase
MSTFAPVLVSDRPSGLAHQQHSDGGWGDGQSSQVATTILVRAAFQITGVPVQYADLVERADAFILSQGGFAGLKAECHNDKTSIAPIVANCAMAGSTSWRQVPALPFERICFPQSWSARLRIATKCFESPGALAVGLAKFYHDPPRNPFMRVARQWASNRVMPLLQQAQSSNGGFLGSIPQSSSVVMSLASMGHAHLPLVRRSVEYLFASLRPDGSWPVAACPTA